MVQNSAHKKEARRYQADHPGVNYTEAMRRTKRLKVGDIVKVTVPGLCRFKGTVTYISDVAIDVRRHDDNSETAHLRDNIEFLERPNG